MPAPAIIHDLVRRFEDSRELYHSGKYNEAQLRVEFLNRRIQPGQDVESRLGREGRLCCKSRDA